MYTTIRVYCIVYTYVVEKSAAYTHTYNVCTCYVYVVNTYVVEKSAAYIIHACNIYM